MGFEPNGLKYEPSGAESFFMPWRSIDELLRQGESVTPLKACPCTGRSVRERQTCVWVPGGHKGPCTSTENPCAGQQLDTNIAPSTSTKLPLVPCTTPGDWTNNSPLSVTKGQPASPTSPQWNRRQSQPPTTSPHRCRPKTSRVPILDRQHARANHQTLWLLRLEAVSWTTASGSALTTSPICSPDRGWQPASMRLRRYFLEAVVARGQGTANATSFVAP